jgi:hypothetical protein
MRQGDGLDSPIKILLLRSTFWSSEPEAKNVLAKIRQISRIGLIRFSYWREYAPRTETKPLDATKKRPANPPAFSNFVTYRFLKRLLQVHLVPLERRGKPTYRFLRAPRRCHLV